MDGALCELDGEIEALMCRDLRGGAPIAPDYPLVFGPDAPGRLVSVEEEVDGERRVRAACAVLVREAIVPGARFRVGFIGSVVTAAEHRKQGWGRTLLAKAEETLREAGCLMSLLWADQPDFYHALGYRAIGTEDDYLVDPSLCAILPSLQGVREVTEEDLPAVFELYRGRGTRIERSAEEMDAMIRNPGMEVLVREHEGQLVAYSCLGRGADFASVVHEWAGEGEHVLALLQGHLQRRAELGDLDPLVMMVSAEDLGLRHFFELVKAHHARGMLGLGKLLDPAGLRDLAASLAGEETELSGGAQGEDAASTEWTWSAPGGELSTTPDEVFETLFEPEGTRAHVERVELALGAELPRLPLQPFVWGLDSI